MAAGCACPPAIAPDVESPASGIPRPRFAVDRQVLERHLRRIVESPATVIPFTAAADRSWIRLAAIHLLAQLDAGHLDLRTVSSSPPLWKEEAETIARYLEHRPGAGAVSEDGQGLLVYVPKVIA